MIYTLGESLMDIIFDEDKKIEARAGGAMLNLSVSLGRCGLPVTLISELGDDKIATKILDFLNENNISSLFIECYENQATSIALAFLDENRVPTYSFHKSYPENRNLKIPTNFPENDILIFGSIYSLDAKIREQVKQIVNLAKRNNTLIIYDPNIRNAHHLQDEKTRKALFENLAVADIIKGSDEDFQNIFGLDDDKLIVEKIRDINDNTLIIITKGEKGATLSSRNYQISAGAIETDVKSTIGAGDNFTAGMVFYLNKIKINKNNIDKISLYQLEEMLKSGSKFSSEVCASYDNYVSSEFVGSL